MADQHRFYETDLTFTMRIVIALGGNALLQRGKKGTFEDQQEAAALAMSQIVQLVKNGYDLVLTHGNGPQCGAIFLQNVNSEPEIPAMPLHVCGAMSQGFLGEMIQQELDAAIKKEGLNKKSVSIVTQSYVDPNDPAFQKPTKPIGQFYTEEKAKQMQKEKGYTMMEDAGRGWRIVVPSPVPVSFVEQDAIKCLVNNGFIVICSGGGGIPVIDDNGHTKGVEAVIDKDLGASVLAEVTESEAFMILTDVQEAMINFRKPDQQALRDVTVAQMKEYIAQGQFYSGSMLPKVQACIRFVERTGKPAIITSLDHALQALRGECGTKILP
ncbi:Carbamate kinase [Histomonas meleagridis]|uniref:Carbamate kinase n=1 Tax=Histomonas meleagridis TaxID=135588 RepID=UPI0035593D1C|nr:Carbamate kinase [Histomonas meleagridis]KAH0806500.1 Carbamate kinase [Histomonas meleagridis]